MFKVYGSAMCPDCRELKANFDYHKVDYQFIDINASLKNLGEFLYYRDHDPVFDHWKEIGDIGLPAIVREDGSVFLDWEEYLRANGKEIVYRESGPACHLDGRGC
jgi:glutaredoxin-related protein